ncbi:MAG TPA: 50S ribosomal protein L11 methyltransferase [Fibrobacteria bacterium]|nr:50S ribosomal protein L11 methyltransferase [Fibrobacteria bacterium]
MDSYWWLCFRTANDSAELDQDRLFELEATGIEEVGENAPDGAPAPPADAPADVLLKAFFGSAGAMEAARAWFRDRKDLSHGEEKIEDWDRSWRERQTPVEVTPSLVVMPPWVNVPADGRHVIRLEAKMAFGTGSHESTRIAATLLERIAVRDGSVLDIGTGTGILALYAAQLGAASVLALDIDPVVGPCLDENLALNPPPPACRFRTLIGGIDSLAAGARFDVVICNMIRTELWPFREQLRNRLSPAGLPAGGSPGRGPGVFVVSGQRLEDKPHFLAWRGTSPFRILLEVEMEGWWGFAASRE